MKKYENPIVEILELERAEILTFSLEALEPFDPSGSDGPTVDVPDLDIN